MNDRQPGGAISLFTRHRVAGNLLMALMLLFGTWGLMNLNRQVMPDFTLDVIQIIVEWPGASPEDLEANVVKAIEPEVRFLDGVRRVIAVASASRAEVTVEFEEGVDISGALADVQAAVARITTFPTDIERPVVRQFTSYESVCRIEIAGPFPEGALKTLARVMRDDLLDLGAAHIDLQGVRDSEIWVELRREVLRRLDMRVADVARRIEEISLDLPSGSIEVGGMSRQIRSESLARTAAEVGKIDVVFGTAGERLQLRDIARVFETFAEGGVTQLLDGNTAVALQLSRTQGTDSVQVQRLVNDYLQKVPQELPPTLTIRTSDVIADHVTERVRMLTENSMFGLILVLAMLFLFLNGRLAFWVAMGLPVAVMATFGGMAMLGMSLNMISMFAIIMGIGIIVDDAIVVAERAEILHHRGMSPEQAVLGAARMMYAPVLAASLTTIAAVFPILTVGTTVGRIIGDLPITIILVICASLVECFLILPAHLKHALRRLDRSPRKATLMNAWFTRFRDERFGDFARACYTRRYTTVFAAVCILLLALTLPMSGRVGFEFFATPQSDSIYVNFAMAPGTPRHRTREMLDEVARALHAAEDELTGGRGGLVLHEYGSVGSTGGRADEREAGGDHVGSHSVELVSGDIRKVRNTELIRAWESHIRPLAGLQQLTLVERSAAGPPGRDLDVRVYGDDLPVLKAAARSLRRGLMQYPGTMAVEDNLPYGKDEILIELTPAGSAMGFTAQSVAREVRAAFEGIIARRFSAGDEEVIVRVKLAESYASPDNIRDLYLRAPDGNWVPLTEVATLRQRVGFSRILREDGRREVSVTGEIDGSITTSNEVLDGIARDVVPGLEEQYGIEVAFMGRAEEQREALGDTAIALGVALLTMYVILAWVFASYTTPLVVMAMIPFGLVGAMFGHWVMGFNLNMFSIMALLGLAGVMVNDSIILIAAIKRLHASGEALQHAVAGAAKERLRPTLLTTLTTIGGLLPLLLEGSVQALLVQPLAVTLIFGLLFEPALVLLFVPAMLGIGSDLRQAWTRRMSVSTQG